MAPRLRSAALPLLLLPLLLAAGCIWGPGFASPPPSPHGVAGTRLLRRAAGPGGAEGAKAAPGPPAPAPAAEARAQAQAEEPVPAPQDAVAQPRAPPPAEESVDPWTYVFGKPGEMRRDMGMMNTSPEKILLATVLALVIGLGANLWGQTEFYLSLFPAAGQVAVDLKLDALYAVDGLRAYYGDEYEARYPREWLFDQRVALAKFGQSGPDEYLRSGPKKRSAAAVQLPDAAWGPAGGGREALAKRTNLSVVKQLLPPRPGGAPQEIAEILGEPEASLDKLLTETIAPAGGKKTAERLRAARTSKVWRGTQNVYYEYEWSTKFGEKFALRTYSSAALGPPDERGSRWLYTLTAVLPEEEASGSSEIAKLLPRILDTFYVNGAPSAP